MKRLVEETACPHNFWGRHSIFDGVNWVRCESSSRVVVLKELPYAKEAVELWHENGLTVEFLEGMSYNHRVQLVGAANRYCELVSRELRADE